MAPRYLFFCPDGQLASGGTAVIYDVVAQLRADGHDAVLVHMGPAGRYSNSPHVLSALFSTAIMDASERRMSMARQIARFPQRVKSLLGPRRNQRLQERADDIFVFPDFMLSLAVEAFPGRRKIILVQNSFIYLEMYADARARGLDPMDGHLLSIGISDTCMQAFDLVGAAPHVRVRVAPNLALFSFEAAKKKQIAYMPRKRPLEAGVFHQAIEARGRLSGYSLVSVDGMPQVQVAQVLRESLFFVSFMKREALGFPGLEAMSAGCIVVGYTGLGTREYFTPATGIPVEEEDTFGLVTALEQAVAEYDRDPARLDALRRHASDTVTATYAQGAFVEALRAAWANLPGRLR